MNTKSSLLLIEEFSEQELEAISGGAPSQTGTQRGGLVQVQNVAVPVNVDVRNIFVNVNALNSAPVFNQV